MAIFTKQFKNADEYEEWLAFASGRINVLAIENSPTLFGASTKPSGGPVKVRYQTHDRSLAPARSLAQRSIEIVLVAAAFFALFLYLIYKA